MPRKSEFVKVTGDLYKSPEFIAKIAQLSREYFVVICVGGGKQINEELLKKGHKLAIHGPLGRELPTFKDKQIARDILERNRDELQDILADKGISASVVIPALEIGTVLCHVNGDEMVRTAYLGFDKLIIVTTPDRLEKKKKEFADLPKVEVIGLDFDD